MIQVWLVRFPDRMCDDRRGAQRRAATNAALREILSHRLRVRPEELTFERKEGGKPVLTAPSPGLAFNVSHSGMHALIALAPVEHDIGVDIEDCDRIRRPDALCERLLGPEEIPPTPLPSGIDHGEACRAACHLWVRKEAVLKALGTGFSISPKAIPLVALSPGMARLDVPDHPRITVLDLPAPQGSMAAVASSAPFTQNDVRIQWWPETGSPSSD